LRKISLEMLLHALSASRREASLDQWRLLHATRIGTRQMHVG
jgi:hypothetical protein